MLHRTASLLRAPFALARLRRGSIARVAFSMLPVSGPWGGGNQWLLQMMEYFQFSGCPYAFDLRHRPQVLLLTHAGLSGRLEFSPQDIAAAKRADPALRVIHRVNDNDIRKGTGARMDEVLSATDAVADHTVFISDWLRDHHAERWFDPARPHSVIYNGAPPRLFHPVGSLPWPGPASGQPLRIVTHHWSDHPLKGFDFYQHLDDLIAAGRLPGVEFHYIGRYPSTMRWRATTLHPPCTGPDLAALLRKNHLYLTATRWEPCGMHHVEGAQCGLPVLYHLDGGGVNEMAARYGIGFTGGPEELLEGIQKAIADYPALRARVLAHMPSGHQMALDFARLAQALAAS